MKLPFSTEISGYSRTQVQGHLTRLEEEHTQQIRQLQERIAALRDENAQMHAEISALRASEQQVASALIRAQEKAEEILQEARGRARTAQDQAAAQMALLYQQENRFRAYLRQLCEDNTRTLQYFQEEMQILLDSQMDEETAMAG